MSLLLSELIVSNSQSAVLVIFLVIFLVIALAIGMAMVLAKDKTSTKRAAGVLPL